MLKQVLEFAEELEASELVVAVSTDGKPAVLSAIVNGKHVDVRVTEEVIASSKYEMLLDRSLLHMLRNQLI